MVFMMASSLYADKGKVRIASDKQGAYIYVDGKKKAMTGEGFTSILLEEGDHVIKVVKEGNKYYQGYAKKSVFVGAETSVKINLKLNKLEPTPSYREVLQQKDIPKFQRWKRSGNVVKDTKLGLIWQDNLEVKTVQRSWKEAKRYCQNLSLAGFTDWRLPSYDELLTIVDYDRYRPAIMPSFNNVAYDFYWSSSKDISDTKYNHIVHFVDGFTYVAKISKSTSFVRCVRGR